MSTLQLSPLLNSQPLQQGVRPALVDSGSAVAATPYRETRYLLPDAIRVDASGMGGFAVVPMVLGVGAALGFASSMITGHTVRDTLIGAAAGGGYLWLSNVRVPV